MFKIDINTQPTDETCGATCLHAIYNFYGMSESLDSVIKTVKRSLSGGTLAPTLGMNAIERGFKTTIFTNNLAVFDPSWFGEACAVGVITKLNSQIKLSKNPAVIQTSTEYKKYLQLGGRVLFRTLNIELLMSYFKRNIPILTGLSSTYLYSCARDRFTEAGVSVPDDIVGSPCGHFVILHGYDERKKLVSIADPYRKNELTHDNYYKLDIHRVLNAIMLGVLTHDGNLLIIEPKA